MPVTYGLLFDNT